MELKPRILSVVGLIFLVTLLFVINIKQNADDFVESHTIHGVEDNSVLAWVDAFSKKDFSTCDMMLEHQYEALYSGQVYSVIYDQTYYDTVLAKLVDCISSIEVENVDKSDSESVYGLRVTFKPYKKIDSLNVKESSLNKAKKRVLSGDSTQFGSELDAVYLEIFKDNCFKVRDKAESVQQVLTLSEKEVNGVTYVYNTVSFVDSLLSDSNISNNIMIYEQDVKEEVDNIIKAY